MPIYDLICTACGYEKGEIIFPSYDAFQKAETERECPECHSKLEAKLSYFNICEGQKYKTTNGKICEKSLGLILEVGEKPCGHVGLRKISLAEVLKVQHDPEMN
jgi:predicted nucleic acid-binding Zn ribbon protein